MYNQLRGILGADELINDWSANSNDVFTVDTDWVVTIPGQYVMLNLATYLIGEECKRTADLTRLDAPCDFRDIPMTATIDVYDREEQVISIESGELVVSPSPPVFADVLQLEDEVNVIEWGTSSVLNGPTSRH